MKIISPCLAIIASSLLFEADAQALHFVFTSDVHFGITRPHFRGQDSVRSLVVNKAEVRTINALPKQQFPGDDGLEAGSPIRYIDDIIITGDIANREETPIQPASLSWKEFLQTYKNGITTQGEKGKPTGLLLTPGNHDASNAIGYFKPMLPLHDASSMVGIYSMMMGKEIEISAFDYKKDKINFVRSIGIIHLFFLNIWPDSANRIWMEKQLASIPKNEPVLVFAHDPPTGDPKHFMNPRGTHDINSSDKFENLLEESYKDSAEKSTDIEQEGWVNFLKQHRNIKAYFHGHNNYSEMYTYTGPKEDVTLPVFRADSPMKGKFSQPDEKKLSFDFISIDPITRKMTVRECLWNEDAGKSVHWGETRTISL